MAESVLTEERAQSDPAIAKEAETLRTWTWNYAKTPAFSHSLEHRFPWGLFQLHLDVTDGTIARVAIFSDTLAPDFVDALKSALEGCMYSGQAVWQAVGILAATAAQHGLPEEHVNEFAAWIVASI